MALYDGIGHGYSDYRRPDPRIACAISDALGACETVVNVGAGAGGYEPVGRTVLAVEPSQVMIDQRPDASAPCVCASAEDLPLEEGSYDAAMTVLSLHHWQDQGRGLAELARVARARIVILTWVPEAPAFWLTDEYFPEILAYDRGIFPGGGELIETFAGLGWVASIAPMLVPHDCSDGFLGAYWRRPAMYLDEQRRAAISSFARIDAADGVARLREDLRSGEWRRRHGRLLDLDGLDIGYRLVVCDRVDPAQIEAESEPKPV